MHGLVAYMMTTHSLAPTHLEIHVSIEIHISIVRTLTSRNTHLKLQVSFAKEPCKRDVCVRTIEVCISMEEIHISIEWVIMYATNDR